jgi:hypothetical protein
LNFTFSEEVKNGLKSSQMCNFRLVFIVLSVVRILRNIFLILIAGAFLIPTTGFYYTRHSCHKTGIVRLVLDEDYSCCSPVIVTAVSSCCSKEQDIDAPMDDESYLDNTPPDCCVNEGKYLKSDEDYNVSGRIKLSGQKFFFYSDHISHEILPSVLEPVEKNAHSPPLAKFSKDILHKHSILLI